MRTNDFDEKVVAQIAKAAMLFCSNPGCLRSTGYSTTEGNARAIAEAAHVLPSGKKGPRAEEISSYPDLKLDKPENGIWLCLGCHKTIDNDKARYPAILLYEWKKRHEEVVRRIVGKDLERALIELRNVRRFHDEARELISFMEDRRMLYEALDAEFPPRVLESIATIRSKLVSVRTAINHDTPLFKLVGDLQSLVNTLLRNIGPETDLTSLRCNSNDPTWLRFRDELQIFRHSVALALKAISGNCDYRLQYI